MATGAVLANLGLYVEPGFLDDELRQRLRSEIDESQKTHANVARAGRDHTVVELEDRATRRVLVSPETIESIRERLKAIMPKLGQHFGVELERCQEPQFLAYQVGDFFHAHMDGADGDDVPPDVRGRKVSAVVFVNGASSDESEADSYTGGELIFYGLMGDDERTRSLGFPLNGTAGELVAFPSDMWHEVNAVTHGERHTIVCWFK
jgi:predicted 2-oxoglutarate/Fe(II)-dependent dioxygenase YbiX